MKKQTKIQGWSLLSSNGDRLTAIVQVLPLSQQVHQHIRLKPKAAKPNPNWKLESPLESFQIRIFSLVAPFQANHDQKPYPAPACGHYTHIPHTSAHKSDAAVNRSWMMVNAEKQGNGRSMRNFPHLLGLWKTHCLNSFQVTVDKAAVRKSRGWKLRPPNCLKNEVPTIQMCPLYGHLNKWAWLHIQIAKQILICEKPHTFLTQATSHETIQTFEAWTVWRMMEMLEV